jgi:hypothetical protein
MKNPFDDSDPEAEYRKNMSRWAKMQAQLPRREPLSRIRLSGYQRQASELLGQKIQERWQEHVRNSGELIPEKTVDESGRPITKFHGDIRSYLGPYMQKPVPFKLAKLTHIGGRAYLTHQLTTIRVPRGSM